MFEKGVRQAIQLQSVIMSQVQFILSTNAVTPSKSFLYTILSEVRYYLLLLAIICVCVILY